MSYTYTHYFLLEIEIILYLEAGSWGLKITQKGGKIVKIKYL